MKKLLFGIFAHPDDEAFGPAGTLYKLAHSGTDVHLVLATNGENGNNPDKVENLGPLRSREWLESGKLIGVRSGHALRYSDGSLSNSLYHEIADKIMERISKELDYYEVPVEIDFMTFEPGGLTGHLDHIAISRITTFVYLKLRKSPPANATIGTLKYYCYPASLAPKPSTAWIFQATGYSPEELDEVVDFSDVADMRLAIMQAHHSQREDMQYNLKMRSDLSNPDCHSDHFFYFKN